MLSNLKSVINWKETSSRKQKQVDLDNIRENRNRIDYDYPRIGQQIYVIRDKIHCKLDGPKKGPYTITDVFSNGTIRIQRGRINERIDIRRLEPHF